MENTSNRRILFAIGFVLFLAIIVLIWYFFYAKPIIAPKLNETNNPFPTNQLPPRSQFINWNQGNTSTTTTEITDPLSYPLVRVWNKPAAGQTFIVQDILKDVVSTVTQGTTTFQTKKTIRATSSVLIFVDRTTGYVYGYPVETGKPFQISNTIIPGVYDAHFFDGGKRVIMRYIDQDKNKIIGLVANVPNVEDGEMALPLEKVQYIPSQVTSVATNFKNDKASYVTKETQGSSVYTLTKNGSALVTTSPFSEWSLSYGGESLYVTAKPSAYISGGTFSIPSFQPEINDKTGLMTTPGANNVMLNSMWGPQGLVTFISVNGATRVLSVRTLATKCGWGEKNFLVCAVPRTLPKATEGLPDDWFQGRVSFNDDMFIINVADGEKYELYTFKNTDGVFDVVNLSFGKGKSYISFNKKQDGSLWLLNLNLLGGGDTSN